MKLNFSWLVEGKLAGHQTPSSEQDLIWLKQQGVLALVRIIEQNKTEVNSFQIGNQDMWDYHEPVPDFGTPKPDQIDRMIQFIEKSISSQRPVGVSCKAGLGRTGTVLACYMISQGYAVDAAIDEVRKKRPGSVETKEQENAVKAYAHSIDEKHDLNTSEPDSNKIKFLIRQWPFPIEEAVDIVISHMTEETKDVVAQSKPDDIYLFHLDVGMWIRNAFGLWKVVGLNVDDAWIPIFQAVRNKLHETMSISGEKQI